MEDTDQSFDKKHGHIKFSFNRFLIETYVTLSHLHKF